MINYRIGSTYINENTGRYITVLDWDEFHKWFLCDEFEVDEDGNEYGHRTSYLTKADLRDFI